MRRLLPLLLCAAGCGGVGLDPLVEATDGPRLALDPDGELRFGEASPEGRSQPLDLTLISEGGEPLYVKDAWVESTTSDVFSTVGEWPLPRNLDPGQELPVRLAFAPDAEGTFHGRLIVEVGNDGTLFERDLVGNGCGDRDRDGECD